MLVNHLERNRPRREAVAAVGPGPAERVATMTDKFRPRCKKDHVLEPYVTGGGSCDKCRASKSRGSQVYDCRRCNWWLCSECYAPLHDALVRKQGVCTQLLAIVTAHVALQPVGGAYGHADITFDCAVPVV